MRKTVYTVAAAVAIAAFVPFATEAQAQAQPRPALSTLKKPMRPAAEARWASMLQSALTLSHEGGEVRRITPPEAQNLAATVQKVRGDIAKAKQGGLSEADEDAIDNEIADLMLKVAGFMSDPQRKAAAPAKPVAKK